MELSAEVTTTAPFELVVIGAQKGGSTYLAAVLGDHPDIYVCPDEVPFFEDPFFANSDRRELDRALATARAGQRRGIHRPDYLAHAEVPERIAAVAPSAQIVAVLRDPVDRALSAYYWYVQFGLLPLVDLDEGMNRLLDGWTDREYPHAAEVLTYGDYGEHLQRWSDRFGRDQLFVMAIDDLRRPDEIRRLYEFARVGADHAPSGALKENVGVYEPRRLRVLRWRRHLAFSWDSTDRYEYTPRRFRRPLAFVPSAAIVGFDRVVLARVFGDPRPDPSPALRARLRARYRDDRERLGAVLGREPWWP